MGWGASHLGNYEIKNNELICRSNLFESESGGYTTQETNITFTFKIIDSNKLELSNINIINPNDKDLIYDEGLTVGMTYSIK